MKIQIQIENNKFTFTHFFDCSVSEDKKDEMALIVQKTVLRKVRSMRKAAQIKSFKYEYAIDQRQPVD